MLIQENKYYNFITGIEKNKGIRYTNTEKIKKRKDTDEKSKR